jgi:hypothetical protein
MQLMENNEMCRTRYDDRFRPNGECVLTMDLDIVPNNKLRSLMQEGTKFREQVRVDHAQVIKAAVGRFITYCQVAHRVPPTAFDNWKEHVTAKLLATVPAPSTNTSLLHRRDVRRCLRQLQGDLVIVPTDKADKNFSLVCKHHYKHVLQQELQTVGGAYETTNQSQDEVTQAFVTTLRSSHCPTRVISQTVKNGGKLPLLYWLPKMHKPTPQARFIAASADVITTPLARLLNVMLGAIKRALTARDNLYFLRTGTRRCWFVDSYEEASMRLRSLDPPNNSEDRCISTYDFTTMYTTLAQTGDGGIRDSLSFAVKEAFGDQTSLADEEDDLEIPLYRYLVYNGLRKPVLWESVGGPTVSAPPECKFTADQVVRLVNLLVGNTYIKNGDCIRRQVTGLPMGTNPAPHLADLTCYPHEARAMDRLVRNGSPQVARRFAGTCRYIDDVLSPDNPGFRKFVQLAGEPNEQVTDPIYPAFLALKCTSPDPLEVEYLGMTITRTPRSFMFKITDTKQKFPVPKVNYPSLHGNFPTNLGYGVLTGQLHRFSRVCTAATDFIQNSVKLCSHLVSDKGYMMGKVRSCVAVFLKAHSPYKTPFGAIHKRICSGLHEGTYTQYRTPALTVFRRLQLPWT